MYIAPNLSRKVHFVDSSQSHRLQMYIAPNLSFRNRDLLCLFSNSQSFQNPDLIRRLLSEGRNFECNWKWRGKLLTITCRHHQCQGGGWEFVYSIDNSTAPGCGIGILRSMTTLQLLGIPFAGNRFFLRPTKTQWNARTVTQHAIGNETADP